MSITSDVGELLGFVSVLVDLGQRPDEARPLVGLGHADLLQGETEDIRGSTPDYLD